MPGLLRRQLPALLVCALVRTVALCAAEDVPTSAYNLLQKNCIACHGAAKTSGLDLRTPASALAGGDHGRAIVPFEPEESRLLKLVSHEATPAMPPGKRLSNEEIEVLRNWIEAGARFLPSSARVLRLSAPRCPNSKKGPSPRKSAGYWAFQRPTQVSPPPVADPQWRVNPIDSFIFSTIADKRLKAAPPADRRTLVRRAYLDLLGLPPSPEEVEAFVNDDAPDAWPKLVDKLLASPHYGERWARHWLDLVRYADSGGFEFDRDRPEAWRYRDYVVKAFNSDKPYDRFVKEQLAGDEYAIRRCAPKRER